MNNFFESSKKVYIRPFIYVTDSVTFDISRILFLLLIQIALLFVSKSFSSLLVILAAILGSAGADFICKKFFNSKIGNNFSQLICISQGIITGMFIPENYPPVVVFFITLFVMMVVKNFFGGFSYAWANPAAFSVLILWIIGKSCFPEYQVSMDLLSGRNPSQTLIESGVFNILPFDSGLTDTLNSVIFSLFKVSIPEGYVSMFWDTHASIPAFRFNFITLISSIIIFSGNLYKLIIPGIFISFYMLLVRLVSPFITSGVVFQGDMILCMLTSGTLFCATFVLNWYGTTPMSKSGKILYGLCAGTIAFVICGPGTSPSGMIFTIIISNIVSIFIQQWENRRDRISLRRKLDMFKKNESNEIEGL